MKITYGRPPNSLLQVFLVAAVIWIICPSVQAQGVIEFLGPVKVSDLSADGSVAVGYTIGDLEVFRWTQADSIVRIGGSTAALGVGGGEPRVSADGNLITAAIPAPDSLTVTQGLWTKGLGWQTLMPPTLPGGGTSGGVHGISWGLSGDGSTVIGLYWLATQRAHASAWTAAGGLVDLGTHGENSRANDANFDGSVIVGWSSDPVTGAWQPAVWEDGGLTVLDESGPICQAQRVTRSGHMIFGSSEDTVATQAQATIWTRSAGSPTGWQPARLGVLTGTLPEEGRSIATGGSFDGRIVIGLNYFSNFNIGYFVWTPTFGVMSITEYLTTIGVSLPSSFRIERISAISEDGRVMAGYGSDLYNPGTVSFLITTNDLSAVPAAIPAQGITIDSNTPNPFNPATTIHLRVENPGTVTVAIFDTRGMLVRRLHDGYLPAGRHQLRWDGRNEAGQSLSSGVYLARAVDALGGGSTRRLMLVK
jgi:uncharacterized membrane protein